MKEAELRRHAKCSFCSKLIGHTGLPLFYTLTIARHGIDARAVQRSTGLAMLLGSAQLGAVMGPDEEMTQLIGDPVTLTVCETCSMEDVPKPVAVMNEIGQS